MRDALLIAFHHRLQHALPPTATLGHIHRRTEGATSAPSTSRKAFLATRQWCLIMKARIASTVIVIGLVAFLFAGPLLAALKLAANKHLK